MVLDKTNEYSKVFLFKGSKQKFPRERERQKINRRPHIMHLYEREREKIQKDKVKYSVTTLCNDSFLFFLFSLMETLSLL